MQNNYQTLPHSEMEQYHQMLRDVLISGYIQDNRTTNKAITLPYGRTMVFDLRKGFPAITTKRLFFAGIRGEIIGFLRGYTNAHDFAALGCPWWMQDANTNTEWLASPYRTCDGDMGRAYGAQWRRWKTENGFLDQVQAALDTIRKNPTSRRIIINAWRPDEFKQMVLPPCHVMYRFQVDVSKGVLHMSFYQRSSDLFLGVPMNIAGAALMLHLFAKATGLRAGMLTHHLDDTHIYDNAIEAVKEQLCNVHLRPPELVITKNLLNLDADALASITPDEIKLANYEHHTLVNKVKMVTG